MSEAIWVGVGLATLLHATIGLAKQVHAVANYRRLVAKHPAHAAGLADVIRSLDGRVPIIDGTGRRLTGTREDTSLPGGTV